MIVVDMSATIVILLKGAGYEPYLQRLHAAPLLISAATLAETLIVAGGKGIAFETVRWR